MVYIDLSCTHMIKHIRVHTLHLNITKHTQKHTHLHTSFLFIFCYNLVIQIYLNTNYYTECDLMTSFIIYFCPTGNRPGNAESHK